MKINWDGLGIAASVACAIHCALLPLLFTSLPLFGINLVHHKGFEWLMIALALLIGTRAMWHGYRRHHHKWLPTLLLAGGFVLLVSKEWLTPWHLPLVVAAMLLIVSAHVANYRFCRMANHCHADDCNH